MNNFNNNSNPNFLSNTIATGQLIKFPTITKLTYDGENNQITKNLYKTNSKLMLKSTSTMLPYPDMTQTSTFRVVEVPRD